MIDAQLARENILSVFNRATAQEVLEGATWYPRARDRAGEISKRYCVPLESSVGIIVALSPQMEWEQNLALAERGLKRKRFSGHYSSNIRKAHNIYRGIRPEIVLKSPDGHDKTFHFYQCIVNGGKTDSVCLDRHALAVALGREADSKERHQLRRRVYRELAIIYTSVARELGLRVSELQAITWVTWKRLKKEETEFDISKFN